MQKHPQTTKIFSCTGIIFTLKKQQVILNVKNAYYIEFPPTFAIRAYGEDLADLHVCKVREDMLRDMFFFTVFDTRRYSWFRNYRLDMEEDTREIEDFEKISLSPPAPGWKTVSDHFNDNLQWAWCTGMSIEDKLKELKPSYDLEDLDDVIQGDEILTYNKWMPIKGNSTLLMVKKVDVMMMSFICSCRNKK